MRDPRKKKIRDYRRMRKSGLNPGLYKLFEREFPEYDWRNNRNIGWDRQLWDMEQNARTDFFTEKMASRDLAVMNLGWGSPPKHFRQDLNRHQRRKELRAVHKAWREDDWDNFYLPRYRHNAAWLWW